MSTVRFRGALRRGSLLAVAVLFAFGSSPAAAYDAHDGPVTVSVHAESSDGGVHTLRVDAHGSSSVQIYEIRAHICVPGHDVHTNFDFGFDGRVCPNVAVGNGDVDPSAAFPNGTAAGRLDGVRVGNGVAHWVNELGYPGSIRCDAAHACDLVVRVQATNTTAFVTVPLCDGRPCATASHRGLGPVWIAALATAALFVVLWIAGARRRSPRVPVS